MNINKIKCLVTSVTTLALGLRPRLMHPKLLDGLTASSKVKITEGERVGARFLVRSISRVEGCGGAPGWGLKRLTSNSITHMDLHKPNNKLVSA
jgi:hypothetical protein